MKIKGKRIIVTGGAGFIGSHLIDFLIGCGVEKITVIDNFFLGRMNNLEDSMKSEVPIKVYREDASDYNAVENIIEKEGADVVFNLAVKPLPYSFMNPEGAYMTSVNIASVFANLLRKGVYETLVHCSSSEAFGSAEYVPMDENHPLKPTTPYSAGKAAADLLVMSYYRTFGSDVRIIRPFNNYGPRQNDTLYAAIIPITIKRVMNGNAPIIEGDGKQTRDFLYVKDTAKAMVEMYEHNTKGLQVNIASGRETSMNEIIENIIKIMGYNGKTIHKPERPGDLRRHYGGIKLAEKLWGFKPEIQLREGLTKTIDWYKSAAFNRW